MELQPRGEVTERFKVLASKASVRETVPWVRIPPSPPSLFRKAADDRQLLPDTLMFLHTVKQVRRIFLIVAGFTLLLLGIVMIFTPGPGTPIILLGLGLLAVEFVWARRLMDRIKRESTRFKEGFLRPEK